MTRVAALLIAGVLGAAFCAATELQAVGETTTSTTTKESEVKTPVTKIPLKVSKEILDKLRYEVVPAEFNKSPNPRKLPTPWPSPSSLEDANALDNLVADERENLIPWNEGEDVVADFVAKMEPEDLVKTTGRMLEQAAESELLFKEKERLFKERERLFKERDRLYKERMRALLRYRTPNVETNEYWRKYMRADNNTEIKETTTKRGMEMTSNMFRTFHRIAHIIPLMNSILSSRSIVPLRPFSELPASRSEDSSLKDKGHKNGDGTMVVMRRFSLDDASREAGAARSVDERRRKFFPEDSLRIDVTFVPAHPLIFLRRPPLPLKEIADSLPDPMVAQSSESANDSPGKSFIVSRFFTVLRDAQQENADKPTSSKQGHMIEKAMASEESPLPGQQSPVPPQQPESKDAVVLNLEEGVQKDTATRFLLQLPQTDNSKHSQETKGTRRKREAELPTTAGLGNTETPEMRMFGGDETSTAPTATEQPANRRLMSDPAAAVAAGAAGTLPMGMYFHPLLMSNMGFSNMKFHQMKPFFKMMPYFMGGNPMMYEKMAHRMKMFPKFPMATGMMDPRYMALFGPIMEQHLMNNMATEQVAAQTTSAAHAETAAMMGATGTMHPGMAMGTVPCVSPCVLPLRGRRSTRDKRSVRTGSEAAFQQAIKSSVFASKESQKDQITVEPQILSDSHVPDIQQKYSSAADPDSRVDLFFPQFSLQNQFYQKMPPISFSKYGPLQRTTFTSKAPAEDKQKFSPGSSRVMFVRYRYPFQAMSSPMGEVMSDQSEGNEMISNDEVPELLAGTATESKESKESKESVEDAMSDKRKRKKFPATSASENASMERWNAPVSATYRANPFTSRDPESLLVEGEASPIKERANSRVRRSLGDGESTPKTDDGPGRRSGSRRYLKARRVNPRRFRSRSKIADDKVKSARPDQMPFLDPTMMDEGHDEHSHRREMGNDFKLSSFDH